MLLKTMIYKAVEVIWIFHAGGRVVIEGTLRGPRGPKHDQRNSNGPLDQWTIGAINQ